MVTILKAPERNKSFTEKLGTGLVQAGKAAGKLIPEYFEEREKEEKKKRGIEKAAKLIGLEGEDVKDLDPEHLKLLFSEKLKQQTEKTKRDAELSANDQVLRGLEKQHGLEEGSLSPFRTNPQIAASASKPSKGTQASRPIDQDQLNRIDAARNDPSFKEKDELGQYQSLISAGVSRENAEAESKLRGQQLTRENAGVQKSFEAQKDFIDTTTQQNKSWLTETKPKLLQMQQIPSEDLISPTGDVFLNALGIPLGALKDPSSELYNKLSQDLLKGLPETYGSRILKVEVDNFLKTIPTLQNSAEGRRMVASNMLKLGEMKEIYYNEMRRKQKDIETKGTQYPRDFEQEVFDQVRPQIDRIQKDFAKLSTIKHVPPGHVAFFDPQGEVAFVPDNPESIRLFSSDKRGGRRIW